MAPPVNPYLRKKPLPTGPVVVKSRSTSGIVSSLTEAPVAQVISSNAKPSTGDARLSPTMTKAQPPTAAQTVGAENSTVHRTVSSNLQSKALKRNPVVAVPKIIKTPSSAVPTTSARGATARVQPYGPSTTARSSSRPSPLNSSAPPLVSTKPTGSFRSQLKQQIESLKRAKQLEKQRKIREKLDQAQAKELERNRLEYEKRVRQQHDQRSQQPVVKLESSTPGQPLMGNPSCHPAAATAPPVPYHAANYPDRYRSSVPMSYPTSWATPAKVAELACGVTPRPSSQLQHPAPLHVTPSPMMNPGASSVLMKSPVAVASSSDSVPCNEGKAADCKPLDPEQTIVKPEFNGKESRLPSTTAGEISMNMKLPERHQSGMVEIKAKIPPTPTTVPQGWVIPSSGSGAQYLPNAATASLPGMHPYYQHPAYPSPYGTLSSQVALPGCLPGNPFVRSIPPSVPLPHFQTKPGAPMKRASPEPDLLHAKPVEPPSPFAETHEVVDGDIFVFKDHGGSFGVTVQCSTESLLVDRETRGLAMNTPATNLDDITRQRRKRRVRMFYSVMTVLSADRQNARQENVDASKQLRRGDIILKIDGTQTGGLPFKQACTLFASCGGPSREDTAPSKSDGSSGVIICCPLMIARRKFKPALPVPLKPLVATAFMPQTGPTCMIPFVLNDITGKVVHGEFTTIETAALAKAVLNSMSDPGRSLGYLGTLFMEIKCREEPNLTRRDAVTLKKKWNHVIAQAEMTMAKNALTFWKEKWAHELSKNESIRLPDGIIYMTDAQRSAYRALPRPSTGCKCGRSDHQYVNDPACSLYADVRRMSTNEAEEKGLSKPKPLAPKNLNAVETAFAERVLKLKDESDRVAREARFVEKMEASQTRKLKLAIYSPSLTALVLSAVAEVHQGGEKEEAPSPVPEGEVSVPYVKAGGIPEEQDEDDDDDDDDVPLVALGKRDNSSTAKSQVKRAKVNSTEQAIQFNPTFLAKLLRYISTTWGHIYAEPSKQDHSWRWEVFHGQTGSAIGRNQYSNNPVEPGRLSFENVQFAMTDELISTLTASSLQDDALTLEHAEALVVVSHLVSPHRTGLLDELIALCRSGILRVTSDGYAVLRAEWTTHVDTLLLNDLLYGWSSKLDPTNKHSMNNRIRQELEKTWARVDAGWAMAADPDDIVYPDTEWEEWKRHFQNKHQSQANEEDGIGRFGI